MEGSTIAIGIIIVAIALIIIAQHSEYSPQKPENSETIKIYKYPDRYPIYDYRHGYTYRTTDEYEEIEVSSQNCCDSPPADKLFYIRC